MATRRIDEIRTAQAKSAERWRRISNVGCVLMIGTIVLVLLTWAVVLPWAGILWLTGVL